VGRIALFRQIATESLLLSLTGGVMAAGVTAGVVKLIKVIGGHAIPRLDGVTIGWPVLLFGLGAAVISAVLAKRASPCSPIGRAANCTAS